jgi:uncharacterized protein YndB with AHSA1/START domain
MCAPGDEGIARAYAGAAGSPAPAVGRLTPFPRLNRHSCTETPEQEKSAMVDILHKVGIKSSSMNDVYQALTTLEGLSAWWTTDTQGESNVGGVLLLRFGAGGFDMRVLELDPNRRVLWRVVDGPQEWIGTKVSFDLKQEGDWTIILFKHEGWKEPVEFMHHCSTKWGVFLLSLKSLIETGKGSPWPNDIKLDSWEEAAPPKVGELADN